MKNLYNLKAEQIVLGSIILNNEFFGKVDFLQDYYFYDIAHQEIFKHLKELLIAEKTADSITLKGFFNSTIENIFDYSAEELIQIESKKKKRQKGLNYLGFLLSMGAGIVDIGIVDISDYAKMIEDLYKKKEMFKICNEFKLTILNQVSKIKANDLIENLRLGLDKIEDKSGFEYNIKSTLDILGERYFEIKTAVENNEIFNKDIIQTGFFDFDKNHNGLPKKELTILAGRPSIGKTTIALQVALNVATKGQNCIFFSLETSNKQIANKILSNRCEINSIRLNHNNIFNDELTKIKNNCKKFEKTNLFIDDTYGINCNYIKKCLKRFKRKNKKIDLIIVDYLQIMKDNINIKDSNRVHEIGRITNGLKEIAKEFDCAVLCLCQLSRAVENRDDKRPTLIDLRDSGEIEQIADIVIFCYRDYYYKYRQLSKFNQNNEKESFNSLKSYLDTIKNDCELLIRKYRNGICGDIKLNFIPKFNLVDDIDKRNYKIPYNE